MEPEPTQGTATEGTATEGTAVEVDANDRQFLPFNIRHPRSLEEVAAVHVFGNLSKRQIRQQGRSIDQMQNEADGLMRLLKQHCRIRYRNQMPTRERPIRPPRFSRRSRT